MAKAAKIDLGIKPEKSTLVEAKVASEPRIAYPSVHIRNVDGIEKLPKGEFNFSGRGKVVHRSMDERNGKKSHSVEIEIMHIEPQGADEEGGLDKALEEIESKKTGKSESEIEADEES